MCTVIGCYNSILLIVILKQIVEIGHVLAKAIVHLINTHTHFVGCTFRHEC